MMKINKILVSALVVSIALGFSTEVAFAQVSRIQFETTPLFGETNFAPGNSVTRWVKLNNDTSESHRAVVRAVNVTSTGDLDKALGLVIKNGGDILYDNTFSDFFGRPELILGQVPAGEEAQFDFVVTFKITSGNEYQNSSIGFNLQIGFEDLETTTDITTTISNQLGGGGGGMSSGSKHLVIIGENAVNEPGQPRVVVVSWTTNIPSTSQVIYGLENDGPYNLNLALPNFGYPMSTPEQDLGKVVDHTVVISGLLSGDYVYRVVSRASPPTVSYEGKFSVPIYQGAPEILAMETGLPVGETEDLPAGEVLGVSNENGESVGGKNTSNLATVFAATQGNWLFVLILILLLVVGHHIYREYSKSKFRNED